MEIIELSDDEPSPQPKRRQGPPQKLESGEGGAARGGEASGVGIVLDEDEPGVRITIDLCEDEDGDGDEGSSVIDLTGDDNATLARKLQRQLNAGTSTTVDLASLHAARQARRTKVKADPDAPTISVEEDDLLYEERRKLKTFLQSSAQGMALTSALPLFCLRTRCNSVIGPSPLFVLEVNRCSASGCSTPTSATTSRSGISVEPLLRAKSRRRMQTLLPKSPRVSTRLDVMTDSADSLPTCKEMATKPQARRMATPPLTLESSRFTRTSGDTDIWIFEPVCHA